MNREILSDVLRCWNLEPGAELPEAPLAGSPERSLFRTVVEDSTGRRLVLDRLNPSTLARKREIASSLDYLARQGLAGVHPCLRAADGDFIAKAAGGFWQISPFVDGVELIRPGYTREAWRGEALARFLVDLEAASQGIPFGRPGRPFSVAGFIREFVARMVRHNPEWAEAVGPACRCLEAGFFAVHDRLPAGFCHGDPHALNVIWGDRGIRGVIDWEFSGHKPQGYDAALVVGCIGMEDPSSLAGPFVLSFLDGLRASRCLDAGSLAVFPEFVLALRFAWLSDWLRKKDWDMVEMETDYIRLLLDGRDSLRRAWAL